MQMMPLSRRALLAVFASFPVWTGSAFAQAGFARAAQYSGARRGVSLVVMQGGAVVFEDYPNQGAPDMGWELASGTKSFSGIMAAAAAFDGWLSLDERCADTLPEWRGDPRKSRITIGQLLSLTSGLDGGRIGRPPRYQDAIAAPTRAAPGESFDYGPAPFQVFGAIMARKLAARGLAPDPIAYLQSRVLDALGIRPTRWRSDRDEPRLPSGAAFTARDWARFGQFVLRADAGAALALQLDRGVLRACFTGSAANPGYGLTWWLLRAGLVPPGPRAGIDEESELARFAARHDVRMAAGAGNQRLYLVPARDLVIVRQATGILGALFGRGAAWSDVAFLEAILD